MAVRRPVEFVGKSEYLNNWRTRYLLPALGMIPVNRPPARPSVRCSSLPGVLARSGLFAIYPEGTRVP